MEMKTYVDSNENRITVETTNLRDCGRPVVIARLVDEQGKGYLATDEGTGGFGSEDCPSSYGMPCLTWFGPGERYPDSETALDRFPKEFGEPDQWSEYHA